MSNDFLYVRRASRAVGLYVGVASALIIAAGVGLLVLVILLTSRREGAEHGPGVGGDHSGDDFVVDIDKVLPAVILLGVVGVLLLAVVAWLAARRSVQPLSDALRLQQDFVADASHELRTPLTTLTSRIQVLQRRHARGEPIEDNLAALRRDATMMNDVLNDLLISAEQNTPAAAGPALVSVAAEAAAASLQALADQASVTLIVDADQDVAVRVPPVTLMRAIVALVDNAVQHSPEDGIVRITVRSAESFALIRVADEGGGISGIAVDRVFDRFARSADSGRRRGFGLGLSLVRDIAVRAGGSIEVEATSDRGTTFLVRLPAA
ncbi:sensor histidine kinase [Microbacterium enclense]|jgi:two-component system OmpR family sensor kinase|uniref:histidine kinase n=1 Tax=Microbacterium enclense TaxID=993073 RepID=A0A3S3MCN3_9MICO|nr:HAMP domain-containing sensor histidine kinase [Microbacterium enclense]RWR18681.1 sensor histidine kinase [Microbacterium enclense]